MLDIINLTKSDSESSGVNDISLDCRITEIYQSASAVYKDSTSRTRLDPNRLRSDLDSMEKSKVFAGHRGRAVSRPYSYPDLRRNHKRYHLDAVNLSNLANLKNVSPLKFNISFEISGVKGGVAEKQLRSLSNLYLRATGVAKTDYKSPKSYHSLNKLVVGVFQQRLNVPMYRGTKPEYPIYKTSGDKIKSAEGQMKNKLISVGCIENLTVNYDLQTKGFFRANIMLTVLDIRVDPEFMVGLDVDKLERVMNGEYRSGDIPSNTINNSDFGGPS